MHCLKQRKSADCSATAGSENHLTTTAVFQIDSAAAWLQIGGHAQPQFLQVPAPALGCDHIRAQFRIGRQKRGFYLLHGCAERLL